MEQIAGIIFDDNGMGMKNGSLALINGKHERVVHFEGDSICVHDWPDDEPILSVERVAEDRQRYEWPDFI